jgi:hypothetical protein
MFGLKGAQSNKCRRADSGDVGDGEGILGVEHRPSLISGLPTSLEDGSAGTIAGALDFESVCLTDQYQAVHCCEVQAADPEVVSRAHIAWAVGVAACKRSRESEVKKRASRWRRWE